MSPGQGAAAMSIPLRASCSAARARAGCIRRPLPIGAERCSEAKRRPGLRGGPRDVRWASFGALDEGGERRRSRRRRDRAGERPLHHARRRRGRRQVGSGEAARGAPRRARARGRPHARAGRLAGRRGAARGDPVRLCGRVRPRRRRRSCSPPPAIDHLDKTILPALEARRLGRFRSVRRFDPRLSGRGGQSAAGLHRRPRAADRRRDQARPDADPRPSRRKSASSGRRSEGRAGEAPTGSKSEGLAFHRPFAAPSSTSPPPSLGAAPSSTPAEAKSEVAAAIWSAVEARLDPAGALKAGRGMKKAESDDLPEADALARRAAPAPCDFADRPQGRRSRNCSPPIARAASPTPG